MIQHQLNDERLSEADKATLEVIRRRVESELALPRAPGPYYRDDVRFLIARLEERDALVEENRRLTEALQAALEFEVLVPLLGPDW